MLFLLGFKVQAAQTMHKNGVVLSPPFQNDLSQMKDAWFPTWCKLQKNARPILLCHKLIFRRCWKARKCNYGKIALRQTSTCQVLPFSITHLSPLIVADNAPSVCALSEGRRKAIPRAGVGEVGVAPSRSMHPRATAKPWWCPRAVC